MNFINNLNQILNNEMNQSITENGALGFRTTGKNLLDLNFAVASLRMASDNDIINAFLKAYYDDRKIAVKWLFYTRDVRGGLGERRLFRIILKHLAINHKELPIKELMKMIPEYGRYDDLFELLDSPFCDTVIEIVKKQLSIDLKAQKRNGSISLLAKWMPSINTSSDISKTRARCIASKLGMSEKEYRKTLSSLRGYLDVVECKMSANQFGKIRYEAVPSKANLIYMNAFMRHDKERRVAYLERLANGETKINAAALYPHEIVHAYMQDCNWSSPNKLTKPNETLEQLWKAQLDTTYGVENSIVVADGSGSMLSPIGGSSCTALSVANALAIYIAEKSKGQFKNKYITFSENPQLVDLSKGKSLREKLEIALVHNEVANTNIYKVFQLILHTALKYKMSQSELPQNIIIVSDMEFDVCAEKANENLFSSIAKEYKHNGYKLPRLIFWNVNSRTRTIPIKENALGVALVSGFSTNIFRMVLSNKLDPYSCLLDILNVERYEAIDKALADKASTQDIPV